MINENFKMPLTAYVLYHSDFADGQKYFECIYQLLCRDIKKPLIDGIDIPVYLRVGKNTEDLSEINLDESRFAVIILLIDDYMFHSCVWEKYVDRLFGKITDTSMVIPIGLSKYAFEILPQDKPIQSIELESYIFDENIKLIQSRLLESMIRLITNSENKIKLFISHAKIDGVNYAKLLKDYLSKKTKLDSFFDASDILEGISFKQQIKNSIQTSLLVVLKTDIYSDREWCRIEVITAKKHQIPMVVVNCIEKQVKRTFPYMGNCPMINYKEDWSDMILILLKSALNQEYQKLLLSEIKKCNINPKFKFEKTIPNPPELYTFIKLEKGKELRVLYPEPPLGNEELEILNEFDCNISFLTPSQMYMIAPRFLNGVRIAMSISEPENIFYYGCSEVFLRDITLELSKHILIAGGHLVYGGDLRNNGFTRMFEDFSYQYGTLEKSDNKARYFTNYFSWPIHLDFTNDDKTEFKHNRVNIVLVDAPDECPSEKKYDYVDALGNQNLFLWSKALTKMRMEMESNIDARIFLGGRLTRFKGKYPGLLEEFLFAKNAGHPIFLLGGLGGVSKVIVDIIEKKEDGKLSLEKILDNKSYNDFVTYYNIKSIDKIDYNAVFNEINNIQIKDLNNGLNETDNMKLVYSTNILEIVSLVLKGLNSRFLLNIKGIQ